MQALYLWNLYTRTGNINTIFIPILIAFNCIVNLYNTAHDDIAGLKIAGGCIYTVTWLRLRAASKPLTN